jgi:hypothetical protein
VRRFGLSLIVVDDEGSLLLLVAGARLPLGVVVSGEWLAVVVVGCLGIAIAAGEGWLRLGVVNLGV